MPIDELRVEGYEDDAQQLYVVYVKKLGTDIDGNSIYRFYLSENPDDVFADGWGEVPACNVRREYMDISEDQQDMRDKPFHEDKGNTLYTATKDILASCADKETRKVAIAIYLSFDYEADAYLNELYSDMVGAEPDVFKMNEILQNSLVYKYLQISQKLLDNLNSRTTDCSVAIDEYSKRNVHLTQSMIQNRVSCSVRRIYRKLGKVIVKAKKDTVEHAMGLGKRRLYNVT